MTRTNDDSWESVFVQWLRLSKLRLNDVVFVLSVSGGNQKKNVSMNIVAALKYARSVGSQIVGIVGDDGGFTATVADACVRIPAETQEHITPHAEAFQAVIWHLMVSHPALKREAKEWTATS